MAAVARPTRPAAAVARPPARRRRWDDAAARAAAAARRPRPPATTTSDDAAPSLELDAPRTARTRAKSITVELTASGTGRVQLTLARGDRVVARTSVKLDRDGTADARLKLPKGLKAGRYTLKATYNGGQRASSKLTLRGKATGAAPARAPLPRSAAGARPARAARRPLPRRPSRPHLRGALTASGEARRAGLSSSA